MFLVYQNYNVSYAVDLDQIGKFYVKENTIHEFNLSNELITEESNEAALARFNDILEAAANSQKVYDARKEVGYWKKAKPGPKPKAKAPASQEHQEPAPKK